VVRLDRPALGYALGLEAALTALAAFGGPHGTLGAWPWTLQLPGILLVLLVPGSAHFFWRVGGMLLIQSALWYGIMAGGRRLWTRGRAHRGGAETASATDNAGHRGAPPAPDAPRG
jgi:hypothetical protein